MPAEVVIRPVRPEDAEAIQQLRLLPSILDGTTALPSETVADARRRIEGTGPRLHILVAVLDGQVVGMAGLHVHEGKLRHTASVGMMVHDRFQGQGIGRELLLALLDLADNYLGVVRVDLEVFADNTRAIRLYESLGFEHEGRKRKAVWRRGEHQDVLLMGRPR